MKTAEEIYKQMYEAMPYHIHSMVKPYILEAMKIYAEQAIQEGADRIYEDVNSRTFETVLSVKEDLK